ncbi:myxochelin export MFS transporter MxcK [Myxococcus sp. AM001]|uniref:myxochelin export MFS transporter MxcK n=1 Tax=Myxococcus vastator TaxID=2709664 RepID=UPI0013CF448C|nr:myxochelin export MFS transporter MxcK [Myxococcus vastator]NVJ07530.1 myxochelin export MFS transporter MxcK [Myxococcus sp. AM001]
MTATFSPRQERLLILLLAGVQFTHLLDFMIVLPLGPEFMRLFSLSAAQFGTLVSSYTLASAAMGVLGLAWVDRFGRRSTLLVILGGFITATLACGAAQSHAWLLVARSLAGGCAGLMGAVIMSIIADTIPGERRGQAIGTVMSSLGLSAVAGVPLSLGLANLLGWRAPFWAIGVLGALLWFGLLAVLPRLDAHVTPGTERQAPSVTALFTPGFALGWLLTFSVAFSSFLLIPYLSAFMVGNLGLKQTDLPWVYLAGGAATLLAARQVGRWVDRFGPARVLGLLLVGTLVPHLGFTHLPASPLPVVMVAFVLFMSLTSTRPIPTIALISARVPPPLRGRYMAMNMAASDGASGLAAWASGLMLATAPGGGLVGFGLAGWLAVGVTTVSLFILWTFGRSAAPENRSLPLAP